jgi:hypothetical protein
LPCAHIKFDFDDNKALLFVYTLSDSGCARPNFQLSHSVINEKSMLAHRVFLIRKLNAPPVEEFALFVCIVRIHLQRRRASNGFGRIDPPATANFAIARIKY